MTKMIRRICRPGISVSSSRQQPADDPTFVSILDGPPRIARIKRKHGPGLILLALIPITAFALGTWQVQRLRWKSELIAKLEDRLIRDPLPLPPHVDPSALDEFDYRRVVASGYFRHDQEMLIGPRIRDGQDGFLVVTPLERVDASTVLVNRGWISKKFARQASRPDSLPTHLATVEGLLRKPWKKNMFTPDNKPESGQFYFPDVEQMAALTDSQPVWVESTTEPEFMTIIDLESRGIPIGRSPEVSLRNNHAQYIVTWYSLCLATSVMFYMLVKKPPPGMARQLHPHRKF
ncbi:surfeit locus 1 [Ophiocordyceps camponoti-floridani]|uniref:SURF1-like protein n=1 Tax=Ophiocordyceps camponoti-floridani TaxID=2030778 RepID=A0A8H4Q360_9HYPO|nr:surfeit locus 1 [Ophiocordyceps camponoti-floridani]